MVKKGDARDERYIRPKVAEEKFKLAQGLKQNVYLYGMTGIGKTAFMIIILQSGTVQNGFSFRRMGKSILSLLMICNILWTAGRGKSMLTDCVF